MALVAVFAAFGSNAIAGDPGDPRLTAASP
jgi:hypothetical protein